MEDLKFTTAGEYADWYYNGSLEERYQSYPAKYWKKRLGMVKQRKLRKAPSSAPHAGFAEVLLSNSDTLTDSHLLIIDLPRGARISVGAGVDTEALRIVLEVLVK